MGQEVFAGRRTAEGEKSVVPVSGGLSDYNRSSPALSEQPLNSGLDAIESLEILPVRPAEVSAFTEALIRGFDIVGSFIMLLIVAPVMLLAAILVKISSAGPVLFEQRRVGKHGKIFTLYKFRTMIDGAEKHTGPVWATKEDGRVTPVGKILRCTRLDELPQLFNVLRGDMNLVGPRPERPYFVRQHEALQGIRLMVKPGITGLAQVRSYYDLKPEHKIKYDYLYIQNRSFFLNLYILLKTVPVVLLRKGW